MVSSGVRRGQDPAAGSAGRGGDARRSSEGSPWPRSTFCAGTTCSNSAAASTWWRSSGRTIDVLPRSSTFATRSRQWVTDSGFVERKHGVPNRWHRVPDRESWESASGGISTGSPRTWRAIGSIKHAIDGLRAHNPPLSPTGMVTQDEFSHDILIAYPAGFGLFMTRPDSGW